MASQPTGPQGVQGDILDFPGEGPFELPLFGPQVMLLLHDDEVFYLRLQTAEQRQLVFLPIDTKALPGLKQLIDHAIAARGLGKTKH